MNTIAINLTRMDVVEEDSYLTGMDVVGDDSYSTNMDVVENEDMVFVQEVASYVNADSRDEDGEMESNEDEEEMESDEDEEDEDEESGEEEDGEFSSDADEVKYSIVEQDEQLMKECLTGGYKITSMLGLDLVSIIMCIYILLNVTNPYFIVAFVCVGIGVGLFKIAQVTNKLSDEIIKLREENANLLLFIQK